MQTLSLNVNMRGKTAAVIGGGAVALRKVRSLLAAGATVRVVAPMICPELATLTDSATVLFRRGSYRAADLDLTFLVVAATDNEDVNGRVAADAAARGILVSVIDNPESGDCIFPAAVRRGDLEIAISTGGRCPALAAEVKRVIEDVIGDEYADILEQLACEREKLLTDGNASTYNATVLRTHARRMIADLADRKEPT